MLKKAISDERGRILVWALVILGIGALTIPPLLGRISTNLSASRAIEEGLREQYAADSGVEYALLQLQHGITTSPNPIPTPYIINNKYVEVTWGPYLPFTETYKITSTATSQTDGNSTAIESYVEFVAGGNLDLFHGALASEGDLWLKGDYEVIGDVYCGGDLRPEDLEPSDGDVYTEGYEFPSQEQNEEFALRYKAKAELGGTYTENGGNMTIGIGDGVTITDLGPLYIPGNLSVAKDNIINFQGTVYVGGSIDVDKDCEFTGSGSIVAEGDIGLAKTNNYGTEGSSIIMSLNGMIDFRKDVIISALIYAPQGLINFKKDATVTGSVIGAEIRADKDSSFTYDALHYDSLLLPGYKPSKWEIRTYRIYP
jgi:hypothetical protein